MVKVKMKLAGVPDEQVAKLLNYYEENESTLIPFFDECQKAIVEKAIEKHTEELEEPGSSKNNYKITREMEKDICLTLNKQMLKRGLISEEVYLKAKTKIEKMKDI